MQQLLSYLQGHWVGKANYTVITTQERARTLYLEQIPIIWCLKIVHKVVEYMYQGMFLATVDALIE